MIKSEHPIQVPHCPSNFTPGIKNKFKDFGGEIKKIKFIGANRFFTKELSKNYI